MTRSVHKTREPLEDGLTVVRCTAKLLKLLGDALLPGSEPAYDDWYSNLLWIYGLMSLLMTQSATLFSLF